MKKSLIWLLLAALLIGLTACGAPEEPAPQTPLPSLEDEPIFPQLQESAAPSDSAAAAGQVRVLLAAAGQQELWQELAALYTDRTGVPVHMEFLEAQSDFSTLRTRLRGSNAPTLFELRSQEQLEQVDDCCLDLVGTAVLGQSSRPEFLMENRQGAVKALGYGYEAFGLIVNKSLLERSEHKLEELENLASLQTVAQDIHNRAEQLGFDAFPPLDLDSPELPALLQRLGNNPLLEQAPQAFRQIWELYSGNCLLVQPPQPEDDPEAKPEERQEYHAQEAFGRRQAAFYVGGSWEYTELVKDKSRGFLMNPEDLTMIPLYSGLEGEEQLGLACGERRYWAVNSQAEGTDIQATLSFLYWLVTDPASTEQLAKSLGTLPFKGAMEAENVFLTAADAYEAGGCHSTPWAEEPAAGWEQWSAALTQTLKAHTFAQAPWEAVDTAFLEGKVTEPAPAEELEKEGGGSLH